MSMYIPEVPYMEADYIHTSSGNVVSRSAILHKPENVEIPGGKCFIHKDVQIHGNFAPVRLNRYVIIGEGTKLAPPKLSSSSDGDDDKESGSNSEKIGYIPMSIGDYDAEKVVFRDVIKSYILHRPFSVCFLPHIF